jgi:small subunit ribosomal protein S20
MAITKNAKKAVRTSARKRIFNIRRNNTMRDVIKSVRKTLLSGDIVKAESLVPEAYKAIDKAAKRGVIKENTAARKKSRLVAAIKRLKS